MPPPLDPAKREAIAQAIRDGGKRNEIARQHDVSPSTVTSIAKSEGIDDAFDRAQTQRAREALDQDQALNRARLQTLLLSDAHRLREQLWQPAVMHNFGGRDNTHNSIELPQPTFEQQKAIMGAVSLAVDRVVKLDARSEEAEKQAASLIKGLVDDIRARKGAPAGAAE